MEIHRSIPEVLHAGSIREGDVVSPTDLVIDTYGAFLGRKGERFVVSVHHDETEIAADSVRQIVLTNSVVMSTAGIELALSREIDIVVLDKMGAPIGRIVPCRSTGPVKTKINQITASQDERSIRIVAGFIGAKIANMGYLLKSLGKTRSIQMLQDTGSELLALYNNAFPISQEGYSEEPNFDRIRGIEGHAASMYFSALTMVIPSEFYNGFRSQHPANDLFNSALNYGYGILYHEVESACIRAGLDPYVGFLHANRSGNISFVYDFIEPFRQPIVDRAVITLFSRQQMEMNDADNSYYLLETGKQKVIRSVFERFDDCIDYNGRKLSYRQVLQEKAWEFSRFLNEGREFIPFIHRW